MEYFVVLVRLEDFKFIFHIFDVKCIFFLFKILLYVKINWVRVGNELLDFSFAGFGFVSLGVLYVFINFVLLLFMRGVFLVVYDY